MSLSICCITYNHDKFIAKAIKGMLIQKTDFPVEIIIGADASSDNTREYCQYFAKKYPDRIRLLPESGKLGMMPNFIRTLQACTGDYVAICEGDDYWIDPHKLQKQVDFLESNKSFSICYHPVLELLSHKPLRKEILHGEKVEKEYSITDLAAGNFISTPSVVFRNHLFQEFPSWYIDSPVGDYVLHMLNARHGKIKYLPEPMAVYRRHAQGAWGLKKAEDNCLNLIRVVDYLMDEFDGEIGSILLKQKASLFSQLATIMYFERDIKKATEYADRAFEIDPSMKEYWLKENYPKIISNLFNSKRYRTADMVVNYLKTLGD